MLLSMGRGRCFSLFRLLLFTYSLIWHVFFFPSTAARVVENGSSPPFVFPQLFLSRIEPENVPISFFLFFSPLPFYIHLVALTMLPFSLKKFEQMQAEIPLSFFS